MDDENKITNTAASEEGRAVEKREHIKNVVEAFKAHYNDVKTRSEGGDMIDVKKATYELPVLEVIKLIVEEMGS